MGFRSAWSRVIAGPYILGASGMIAMCSVVCERLCSTSTVRVRNKTIPRESRISQYFQTPKRVSDRDIHAACAHASNYCTRIINNQPESRLVRSWRGLSTLFLLAIPSISSDGHVSCQRPQPADQVAPPTRSEATRRHPTHAPGRRLHTAPDEPVREARAC